MTNPHDAETLARIIGPGGEFVASINHTAAPGAEPDAATAALDVARRTLAREFDGSRFKLVDQRGEPIARPRGGAGR